MLYALARHRFGAPAWIATLAAVPVLYDGYEIELEHLILSDVPFLFLITLATTLLLWDPAGPSARRSAVIGLLLGLGGGAALGRRAAARHVRGLHDHQAVQLAEGRGHRRGRRRAAGRLRGHVLPGARAVRDERRDRRLPLLTGDGVRRVLQDARARRRAVAVHDAAARQAPDRAELHLAKHPEHPAGPLHVARSSPRSRTSWPRTSPSGPSRPSRWTTPRPSSTTPGGCSPGSGRCSRTRRPTTSTCSWPQPTPIPAWDDASLGRYKLLRGRVRPGQPADQGGRAVRRDHPRLPEVRLAAGHRVRAHPAGRAGRHGPGLAAAGRRGAAALGHFGRP